MSLALPRGAELRVADVVRRAAAERGGAVALRHGARAITYRELDERTNRLAQASSPPACAPARASRTSTAPGRRSSSCSSRRARSGRSSCR